MQETVQSPAHRSPSMPGRMRLRLTLLALVTRLPSCSGPCCRSARPRRPSPGQIQNKIDRNQSLIGGHKANERVLTTDISRLHAAGSTRLQSDITALAGAPAELQTSLDAKRARARRASRASCARERAAADPAARPPAGRPRAALAKRLVELYKADAPDLVTVVLESNGFADLLERTEFMQRVSRPGRADHGQSSTSAKARRDRDREAARHAREAAQAQVADADRERSATRSPPSASASSTAATASQTARSQKTTAARELARPPPQARGRRRGARRRSRRRSRPSCAGCVRPGAGRARSSPGSGGLIWPVNGPITSPFCESRAWESCHPGIDIGVPAGTPIRAAAAGRVVLMQCEAPRAATATSPASSTPARCPPVTPTSRASPSRWASRRAGPGDRLLRLHRPLLRRPPALRDPHQRAGGTR